MEGNSEKARACNARNASFLVWDLGQKAWPDKGDNAELLRHGCHHVFAAAFDLAAQPQHASRIIEQLKTVQTRSAAITQSDKSRIALEKPATDWHENPDGLFLRFKLVSVTRKSIVFKFRPLNPKL